MAKITGDVTANYHPHGTAAVYDTLARMAQDFSLRYPLIEAKATSLRGWRPPGGRALHRSAHEPIAARCDRHRQGDGRFRSQLRQFADDAS